MYKKMEKIDLKKHMELFKILPEQEYESLEKALEKGLYLTPQGLGGKLENKNLEKTLPSLYDQFKKIESNKQKQEKIRFHEYSFKNCLDTDFWSDETIAIVFLGDLIGGVILGLTGLIGGVTSVIKGAKQLVSLFATLGIYGGVSLACFAYNMENVPQHYVSPNSLITAGIIYTKNKYKKRKKNKILPGKIKKQERAITKKILKIVSGELGYTEKWLKKQVNELQEMLGTADGQEFANAYNEVKKRLVPLHKLELHKAIEEDLYKELGEGKNIEENVEKLRKARKAGIILDSLEQEIKKEITKKHKHHARKAKKYKEMLEKF